MMKKQKKIRKIVIWSLVAAAVVALIAVPLLGGKSAKYTEEVARTQNIETSYTFSGNVEPDSAKVFTATTRGTVKELVLMEGDTVLEDDEVLHAKNGAKLQSPMDGTISDIYVKEDEDFAPGDQLFRVADYAHPVVKIKVDEYDVSALSKGMSVDVKLQATGVTLTGTVTRIAQEATVENDVAYYEAKVALPQDGTLVMGLTCEVIVPRESVQNATTLSVDAIQYDENNKPYVYCYSRGDEIVTQSVLLGVNNGSIVEIKDGVKSGETVLIPSSGKTMMFPLMDRDN